MTKQPPSNDDIVFSDLVQTPMRAELAPNTSVAIEKDHWWVQRLDGASFGPLSFKDLTASVHAHMFSGDELVQGEHHPRQTLRMLFPQYFAVTPMWTGEIRPQISPLEQFAQSPLKVAVFGIDMRPYEKTDPQGVHSRSRLLIAISLAPIWLLAVVVLLVVSYLRGNRELGNALVASGFASFFFAAGYFTFAGALLEWDFLFNSKKAKSWRYWYGDRAAHKIMLGIGTGFMLLASLIVGLSLATTVWG